MPRQFAPLDGKKNKDYGNAAGTYKWNPENRGKGKCYYETGDEADRCYVTTNGGPSGKTKPKTGPAGKDNSAERGKYNKTYRKQRMDKDKQKKKAALLLRDRLIRVAFDNPGEVRDALLPLLARTAKGKIPPQFLEHVKKKKDDKGDDDKDSKGKKDDDKGKGKGKGGLPPWLEKGKGKAKKKARMEVPGLDMRSVAGLRKAVDPTTYKLAREIYRHLSDIYGDNEQAALNRLANSARQGDNWTQAMHQNNIFKAANRLGIKLPHMNF
jgi:hypothetical protein